MGLIKVVANVAEPLAYKLLVRVSLQFITSEQTLEGLGVGGNRRNKLKARRTSDKEKEKGAKVDVKTVPIFVKSHALEMYGGQ